MISLQGSGDQKFTPAISEDKLASLAASASSNAVALWKQIQDPIFRPTPLCLGPPSPLTQSTYYPGHEGPSFHEDTTFASKVMDELTILPENTRLEKKFLSPENGVLDILQASVAESISICHVSSNSISNGRIVRLVTGDHKDELRHINAYLSKALGYVSNKLQYDMIRKIQESFATGNLATYKDSQRIWVHDKAPPVETVIGFIEPYRDPLGVRSEFEGIVGIHDADETRVLKELSQMADKLVCRLPWVNGDSDNKGPFEKEIFEAPDFSSIQSMDASILFQELFG